MSPVSASKILTCFFLVTSFCACNKAKPSTFQNEAQWLQAVWTSDAELKHTDRPQQNANGMQETWTYQFAGGLDAAVKLFRNHTPLGYTIVQQTDSELWFSRFDGHDSYQLNLIFESSMDQKTTVSVILKSFPD